MRAALTDGSRFTHALIDMRMPPGIDGLQTAIRLREMLPDIRIIFVTAFTDYTAADIEAALHGNWKMLNKPFRKEEVMAALGAK